MLSMKFYVRSSFDVMFCGKNGKQFKWSYLRLKGEKNEKQGYGKL